MPDIQRVGLLAPLPRQNVYAAQEYVPVPLTGVQLRVQVVNFVSQVSFYTVPIYITHSQVKICLLIKTKDSKYSNAFFRRLKLSKSTKIKKRILLR